MAYFRVGEALELEGLPDEGFGECWFKARVVGLKEHGKAKIELTEVDLRPQSASHAR